MEFAPLLQMGGVGVGCGTTVELKFCASCSYRGTAMTMKRMLEISTWLFGIFLQCFLRISGAFEVFCNGDLVFSKLTEQRFTSEFEVREIIGSRLPDDQFRKNLRRVWS